MSEKSMLVDRFGKQLALSNAPGDFQNRAGLGYGAHGAGWRKAATKAWNPMGGSADDDIFNNLTELRVRSRDLYISNPIAAAIINTLVNNVIADGIKPKPKVDGKRIGLSEDATKELNDTIEEEFYLWASNADCDWNRRHNFWALQGLGFRTMLLSGDTTVLLPYLPRPTAYYDQRIRLIESDRVQTPMLWNFLPNIIEGVEISDDIGEVLFYHVRQVHPLTHFLPISEVLHYLQWVKVPAYNEAGRPNMLLAFEPDRPEQRRGVPLLSKVLEILKQLDRFIDSTIAAAVYQSFFAFFVESEMPSENMFANYNQDCRDALTNLGNYNINISDGEVAFLKPGDKINYPKPSQPGSAFNPFVLFFTKMIGAAVQVPGDILLKMFESSYSASRASLLEFGKRVEVLRGVWNQQYNQPIYDQLVYEMVAKGTIKVRGFWDDPRIRMAVCQTEWHGASQGSIDPLKEAEARKINMILNVTTGQREARELNGSDWDENMIRQAYEAASAKKAGIAYVSVATPTTVTQRIEDIIQDTGSKDNPKKDKKSQDQNAQK